ncbi:hypothetical protein [Streptomyces benahoarensis]|nr:hypothetical protein [Streptomyces benahoarensis]
MAVALRDDRGADALLVIPDGTTYPSVEHGLAALGFDGAFTGTYLD